MEQADGCFELFPIGFVRSSLKYKSCAPRQGSEGAPSADLEISADLILGLEGLSVGQDLWLFTWLHQSERSILKVHPRDELTNPETGVFATRSADRPNPIGLHRVSLMKLDANFLTVQPLEAIDGTPVLDIKPVINRAE